MKHELYPHQKPFDFKQMAQAIRNILSKHKLRKQEHHQNHISWYANSNLQVLVSHCLKY